MSHSLSSTSSCLDEFFSPVVQHMIKEEYDKLDPEINRMVELLTSHGANQCWHKHGTFKEHLFHTWRILKIWNQEDEVCRCGLYHSAYSNSYVNLAIFKEHEDREAVKRTVGPDAEELVYIFCRIPRHKLIFDLVLNAVSSDEEIHTGPPREGILLPHIKTGADIHLSTELIGQFFVMTMADTAEQHFGWQDRLFNNENGALRYDGNNFTSLWPGDGKAGLFMSALSRMGCYARACRDLYNNNDANNNNNKNMSSIVLPPVFDECSKILSPENEKTARDLYWCVVTHKTEQEAHDDAVADLEAAVVANPWIAEPHVLLAQIFIQKGDFARAEKEAMKALQLFGQWGTPYDKRISWECWIAWCRVLLSNARKRQWPTTSFGILKLGLVA